MPLSQRSNTLKIMMVEHMLYVFNTYHLFVHNNFLRKRKSDTSSGHWNLLMFLLVGKGTTTIFIGLHRNLPEGIIFLNISVHFSLYLQ